MPSFAEAFEKILSYTVKEKVSILKSVTAL